MHPILLKSDNLLLEFSRENGALTKITSLLSSWTIHRRAELGLSWRLIVPIGPDLKNNPVHGEAQKLTFVDVTPDEITFVWNGVLSQRAGFLDIKVTQTIRLENGQAIWYTAVENHSPYVIESVYSPYIGDLTPPEHSDRFETFYASYNSALSMRLWPEFDDNCGYWGVDYATQYIKGVPEAPYVLLNNGGQGIYIGVNEPSCEMVSWCSEMHPGFSDSMSYRVPREPVVNQVPVHTRFAAIHMPYILPGEARRMTPVVMDAYIGPWQKGADIYKRWAAGHLKDTDTSCNHSSWIDEPHAWLQYQMNSPEDELRMTFKELPELARECAENGIKAIQLVGWNQGGQDQGNPSHEPDHRLGTFGELKEAIARCREMGVKIILFSKFTWADQGTSWFKDELYKYTIKNPYGDYYWTDGYYYQTPAQQLGVRSKPLIPMCFGSEDYINICRKEFQKLADLNCDGTLYDECQHHGPAYLCFDPTHNHRPGFPVYQNDLMLIGQLQTQVSDDFLFAGEGCYDWQASCYGLTYHRSQNPGYIPLARYTRPFWPMATAVTGFNDRNMLHQCLLYRFIISYEPYNFKGRPKDAGKTLEYGKIIDNFRTRYRKYLWERHLPGHPGGIRNNIGRTATSSLCCL